MRAHRNPTPGGGLTRCKADGKDEDEGEAQEIDEDERVDDRFRFWVSTMPTEDFPTFVMQNSIKLT